ncbi:hypothetical protein GCM10027040_08640 [Halomonas shantousis]
MEQTDNVIRFHESGQFHVTSAPPGKAPGGIPFRNVYRWEMQEERIGLYHERRGPAHAVWLFDLVADPLGEGLCSEHAHLCAADEYSARIDFTEDGFRLEWRIQGPRKNETLFYRYTRA